MKGLSRSMSRAVPDKAPIIKLRLPITNLAVAVANGSTAPGIGSAVIGGLPEGNLLFLGAVAYLQFNSADADVIAAWTGSYAVGTGVNANAQLTDATDIDIVAAAVLNAATAKLSPVTRSVSAVANCGNIIDNTDKSKNLNLNVMIDDASQSAAVDLVANGFIDVALIVLGDD